MVGFAQKMAERPVNPFVGACALGDLEEVKRRLDAGEDVNQIDTNDDEIPEEEVITNFPAFVDAARESTTLNTAGKAGIHVAMETWNEKLLRLLDARGANLYLNCQVGAGEIPLLIAIRNGFMAGVKFLIEEKHMLDNWPSHYAGPEALLTTAMSCVEEKDGLALLKYFIEEHNLDWRKARSSTNLDLLRMAELCGMPEDERGMGYTEYLLDLGWDVNEPQESVNRIPIIAAGPDGEVMDMNPLAEMTRQKDLYCAMPLNRVAYAGDLDRVRLYLAHGANPLLPNHNDQNAYDAVQAGLEVQKDWLQKYEDGKVRPESLNKQKARVSRLEQISDILFDAMQAKFGKSMAPSPTGPGG